MPSQQHLDLLASLAPVRKLWLDVSDQTTYAGVVSGPFGQPLAIGLLADKDVSVSFAFEPTANTGTASLGADTADIVELYSSSAYFSRPNVVDTQDTYAMCPEYVLTDNASPNGHYTWTALFAIANTKVGGNTTKPYAIWLCGYNPGNELVSGETESFRPGYFPGSNRTTGLVALIDPTTDRFELFMVTSGYDGTTSLNGVVPLTRPMNGSVFRDLTDVMTILSVKAVKNYGTGDVTFTVHLNGELYASCSLVSTTPATNTFDITTSLYAPAATDSLGNPVNYTAYETQTISRDAIVLDGLKMTCIGSPMLYGTYDGTYLYGDSSPGGAAFPATYVDSAKTASDRPYGAGHLAETLIYASAVADSDIRLLHNYLREKWIVPQATPVVSSVTAPASVYTGTPIQIDIEVSTTAREINASAWGVNQGAADSVALINLNYEFDDGNSTVALDPAQWTVSLLSSNYPTAPIVQTTSVFRITGTAPDEPGSVNISLYARNTDNAFYRQWDIKGYAPASASVVAALPPTPVISELSVSSAQAGMTISGTFTVTDTTGVSIVNQNSSAPNFQVSEDTGTPNSYILSGQMPQAVSRFEVAVDVKLLNE